MRRRTGQCEHGPSGVGDEGSCQTRARSYGEPQGTSGSQRADRQMTRRLRPGQSRSEPWSTQADASKSVIAVRPSGRRRTPTALLSSVGVQRGTRTPDRLASLPSWLAVVGCGTDEPRTEPRSRCQRTWPGSNGLAPSTTTGRHLWRAPGELQRPTPPSLPQIPGLWTTVMGQTVVSAVTFGSHSDHPGHPASVHVQASRCYCRHDAGDLRDRYRVLRHTTGRA